jgi:cytochrome c oxidase subunit II
MTGTVHGGPWRVLIASSHPLFAKGILSLLQKRQDTDVSVVGMVATIEEAINALMTLHPDLVIVDYDDEQVNRDEFLARFVEGEGTLRVVLLSLQEGGDEAIVYDRRTLAAAQIDDWLEKWTDTGVRFVPTEMRGNETRIERDHSIRSGNMKHLIGAAVVILGIVAAGVFALSRANLLPAQASLQARWIDELFTLHFYAIVILFALIVGLMLYSIIAFRRRPGDTEDADYIEGNTSLEAIWTVIPLAAVIYISIIGANVLGRVEAPDPRPLEVRVIGSQWAWLFEYPEQGIISPELVLPVNTQTLLLLTSTDVIHSFWVPEFRVKQDALPGGDEMVRFLRITPNLVGEYKVLCAELCGRDHGAMRAPVRVVPEGEFEAWIQSRIRTTSTEPAGQEEALSVQLNNDSYLNVED